MNSITKSLKSFKHAIKGIVFVIKNENNFRIHLFATILVIVTGFFIKFSLKEWLVMTILIGLVLVTEIINTAIEKLVDFVSPEYHKQAGTVKDISAGAVLVAALVALIGGSIIIIQKLNITF